MAQALLAGHRGGMRCPTACELTPDPHPAPPGRDIVRPALERSVLRRPVAAPSWLLLVALVSVVLSVSAGPVGAAAAGARGGWPVPAPVVAEFQPPLLRWLPGHRGLDFAVAAGTVVRAPRGGVVLFAGPVAGRGIVVIGHGALRSTYEPVAPLVVVGQRVASGQVIGRVAPGAGHCGGEPLCLHWGLRRGEAYLDPRLLIRPGYAVLLPGRGRP